MQIETTKIPFRKPQYFEVDHLRRRKMKWKIMMRTIILVLLVINTNKPFHFRHNYLMWKLCTHVKFIIQRLLAKLHCVKCKSNKINTSILFGLIVILTCTASGLCVVNCNKCFLFPSFFYYYYFHAMVCNSWVKTYSNYKLFLFFPLFVFASLSNFMELIF